VWNKYLTDILVNKVKFQQSKVDECVFYRGNAIYVLYTDDSILAGPDQKEIEKAKTSKRQDLTSLLKEICRISWGSTSKRKQTARYT
jgi:hypothetical protein